VAPVAAALHRPQLGELLLPVAQHVRLHAAEIAHLADGEVALGGNGRQDDARLPLVAGSGHPRDSSGCSVARWADGSSRAARRGASIWAFSFCEAWKVTTRRAEIGISSPVLGLRPGRCGLSRSRKLPKPDSLTLSPRTSAALISSKKVSTMSLASRLFRPTSLNSISASSALVSVDVWRGLAEEPFSAAPLRAAGAGSPPPVPVSRTRGSFGSTMAGEVIVARLIGFSSIRIR